MYKASTLLALALAAPGCVVKYGEIPQPGAATNTAAVSYSDVESELMALRSSAEAADVDQRDRIDAALELIRLAEQEGFSQGDVRDYLDRVVEIERRTQQESVPIMGSGVSEEVLEVTPIQEEELGRERTESVPVEAPPEEEAPTEETPRERTSAGSDTSEAVERARAALAEKNYDAAVRALEPVKGEASVEPLWWEAVNGYVHAERTRAGELFLAAREMPAGDERVAAIQNVLDLLTSLADAYPGSEYEDALKRNIGLVERALEEARSE